MLAPEDIHSRPWICTKSTNDSKRISCMIPTTGADEMLYNIGLAPGIIEYISRQQNHPRNWDK